MHVHYIQHTALYFNAEKHRANSSKHMSTKKYTIFADTSTKLDANRRANMIYKDLIASIGSKDSYTHMARKGAMYQVRALVYDLMQLLNAGGIK